MKIKILVTGTNTSTSSLVYLDLEPRANYEVMYCPGTRDDLYDLISKNLPDAVVICPEAHESDQTIQEYDVLKEGLSDGSFDVMIIADNEVMRQFIFKSALSKAIFLQYPFSASEFHTKLERLEIKLAAKTDSEASPGPDAGAEASSFSTEEFIAAVADMITPSKKHILVVDDEPEQLAIIKGNLKDDYEVTLANNGIKALKYLEKHTCDLMLLDYKMPDMTGPEVFRRMKQVPAFSRIPVIFLTGMSDKRAVVKTITELKPQGYILKPASRKDLLDSIAKVIG